MSLISRLVPFCGTFFGMDDLQNIRYLVGKPGNKKLKRNVPHRLQMLVEKTAWVERLRSNRADDIKKQANLFAVHTDGEIDRFDALLNGKGRNTDRKTNFELNRNTAHYIAYAYFQREHDKALRNGDYFLDYEDERANEALDDAAYIYQALVREASERDPKPDEKIAHLLELQGVISTPEANAYCKDGWPSELVDDPNIKLLCRLIERADIKLAETLAESWHNAELVNPKFEIPRFVSPPATSIKETRPKNISVGQVIDEFLEIKKNEVGSSRYNQLKVPCEVVKEWLGCELPIIEVSRAQAREIAEFLPQIPAHTTKRYPGLSFKQAAEIFKKENGQKAKRWREGMKHLTVIVGLFSYARAEGYIDRNWFKGIKIATPQSDRKKHVEKDETYEPFSIDDLNRIFALPLFDATEGCLPAQAGHHYWAPIIALYSGMRMNEILQLEKLDLISRDDVKMISITDRVRGRHTDDFSKRVKTRNSVRDIPIHPTLLQLGFWDWARKQTGDRIFPEATSGASEKPSDKYSKRFATVLKNAEVWVPRRKVFHSFRNTFNDALRRGGVPLELREVLCGWSKSKSMDSRYGTGHPPSQLYQAISTVSYPGLDLEK